MLYAVAIKLKDKTRSRLILVFRLEDIIPVYRDSPIGLPLKYHNLARPHDAHGKEEWLIGTCIEIQKRIRIPDSFASIINPDVEYGNWERRTSEEHFHRFAKLFESWDEIYFVRGEARRLQSNNPKIQVAPMLYRVEDSLLYRLDESDVSGEYMAIDNQRREPSL